jgi:hypothetical protein
VGTLAEAVWKRLDRPGHDVARLESTPDGFRLAGVAIGVAEDGPYALEYTVTCDAEWRSLRATVAGWSGHQERHIEIRRNDADGWSLDGVECPDVRGCPDLDLSFTPATNTIAVRRLNPSLHQVVQSSAAWLTLPSFRLERLDQRYERLGPSTYRYEAIELAFTARIEFRDDGLVRSYEGLWSSELD